MHMMRFLTICLLLFLFADRLLLADSSPSKRGPRANNRNNTSPVNGSAAATAGHKNKDNRVRQVVFGMISREEWLAKEYFGYLCGE